MSGSGILYNADHEMNEVDSEVISWKRRTN